jgi:2'-5' RNA ligase
MGSNLVIVAIPAATDQIWKVSSEKVPHLTLLFLGEVEDNSKINDIFRFVEHVVNINEQGPFYLDVDRRGILGKDRADVIHFRENWTFRGITQFRNQFLQNFDIRTAFESTEQFSKWQPHLTLGYPETPAHEDKIPEYGFGSVQFDRIAVWTGNYEGPEFRLEWPEREEAMAIAYSEVGEKAAADLLHFGTKGMKWGVRNTNKDFVKSNKLMADAKKMEEQSVQVTSKRKTNSLQSKALDKRHESVRLSSSVNGKVLRQTHKATEKATASLREKPEYKGIHYRDANGHPQFDTKKYNAYEKEYVKVFHRELNKTVKDYNFDIEMIGPDKQWKLVPKEIKHADSLFLLVKPVLDDDGFIIDVVLVDDLEETLTQTAILGEEFLNHAGVKGMRWGVRKQEYITRTHQKRLTTEAANRENRPASDVRAYPTIGSSSRKKADVPTKGGVDHPPTEDAIKVAVTKQKLKKSGVAALTNDELQVMQRRLNLENDVNRLMIGDKSPGKKFIDGLLGRGSKDDRRGIENRLGNEAQNYANPVAKKTAKKVAKKALRTAIRIT